MGVEDKPNRDKGYEPVRDPQAFHEAWLKHVQSGGSELPGGDTAVPMPDRVGPKVPEQSQAEEIDEEKAA